MEWWNGLSRWLSSSDGEYVVSNLVLPAAAIIVAGLVAAWIAHFSVKRLIAKHDRAQKVAAISALIDSAEQASVWNALSPEEQILASRATGQADIQVRLLPVRGSDVAADWAARCLTEMKRESATFGYQIEPAVIEFRDRLLDWERRPSRARRLFQADLDRWSAADSSSESELVAQQEAWVAQQHHDSYSRPTGESTQQAQPTPASAAPARQGLQNRQPAAASMAPAAPTARPDYTDVPTQATPIQPSAPLAPIHEPRPIVQQVASGTGSRGLAPRKPAVVGAPRTPSDGAEAPAGAAGQAG